MLKKSVCVMAFDFGMTRIGVAIGDSLLKIPHPIAVITGKNKFEKFAKIKELVEKWQPTLFVVGIPIDEEESNPIQNPDKVQLTINIKRFSNRLKEQFKLDVTLVNEEYSSVTAASKLNEQRVYAENQKDKLDALAATVILQRYFDEMKIDVI